MCTVRSIEAKKPAMLIAQWLTGWKRKEIHT